MTLYARKLGINDEKYQYEYQDVYSYENRCSRLFVHRLLNCRVCCVFLLLWFCEFTYVLSRYGDTDSDGTVDNLLPRSPSFRRNIVEAGQ